MLDKFETIENARALNLPEVNARINEIINNSKNKRMLKDGFEPNFDRNFNCYVDTYQKHKELCKEHGLVEMGYDFNPKDETSLGGHINNEAFVEYAKEIGVDLTGNEIEAIKTGEYFKEGACDTTIDVDWKDDAIT